jgi:hypothetical protein
VTATKSEAREIVFSSRPYILQHIAAVGGNTEIETSLLEAALKSNNLDNFEGIH